MPNTWHPSRYWDWCMLEDKKKKKKERKKRDGQIMGIKIDLFMSIAQTQKFF